jgi:competence protein ComEC
VGRRDPLAASIATAILIGDRTGLDHDVTDRLQAAGTYHVIAISGGNIAIFASTLLLAAWLARVPRVLANAGAVAGVWLYAALVGGGSSVVRAAAMATIYLGLQARDLRAPPLCALAAAAGVLLVASPLAAVDAGFVLTVGATGAIVALAERGLRVRRWPPFVRPAVAVVAASVATEAVLLPASALLFGRVTIAGPIVNLAAVPAMAVVQQAGMTVVACHAWWPAMADLAGRVVIAAAWVLVRRPGSPPARLRRRGSSRSARHPGTGCRAAGDGARGWPGRAPPARPPYGSSRTRGRGGRPGARTDGST